MKAVTVSSVISFVLMLELFVNLFQCLYLIALGPSFLAKVPHVGLRYMYAKITYYSHRPLEQPGRAWDSPGHLDYVYSSLFAILCHTNIIIYYVCQDN